MSTEHATSTEASVTRSTARSRLAAVGAAVLAALVVWVAFEPIGGIDLRAPAPGGAGQTHDVGPFTVVLPSLLAALAGWALLAVLEKFVGRARTVWRVIAIAVLAVSLGGPLSATGISTGNQVALATMHVAVAVTLIPLLTRTGERS